MRTVIYALALFGLTFALTESASANCGFLGFFADSDYCVVCPDKVIKQNICPGGEDGRKAIGTIFPGCAISYFDKDCPIGATFPAKKPSPPAPGKTRAPPP